MAELSLAQLEKKAGNGQSPLFARLAGMYLDQGKARDALTVCEAGLAGYPYYLTGHLLKGKALLALSMRTEARREFEWVHGFLPGNPAITRLLEQVPPAAEETLSAPPADSHAEFVPRAKSAEAPPPVSDAAASFGFTVEPPAADFGFTPLTPAPAAFDTFGSFGASGGQDTADTPAAPPAFDSMFGLPVDSPAAADFGPSASEPPAFSGLDGFSHDSAASSFEALSAFATPQAQEPSPFEFSGPSESSPSPSGAFSSEEESFDQYASRKRNELTGENSITLEQYLESAQAPPPSSDPIADLAQKLQAAKRMTPAVEAPLPPPPPTTPVINFSAKTVPTATESETPASTGFVTPTLAEIYAKQGWYDDAIKAYRTLANNKPADRDRFLKRIEELEELKSQQGG